MYTGELQCVYAEIALWEVLLLLLELGAEAQLDEELEWNWSGTGVELEWNWSGTGAGA